MSFCLYAVQLGWGVLPGSPGELLTKVGVNLVLVGSGVLCLSAATGWGTDARAWRWLGSAIVCWGLGNVYFTAFLWEQHAPSVPSPADVLWLLFYPMMYRGLVLLLRSATGRMTSGRILDGLVAGLVAAAFSASIVFDAVASSARGTAPAILTTLAYPLGDLILLGLVAGALSMTGWRLSSSWGWIAGALVVFLIADGLYLHGISSGTWSSGSLVGVGWPLAAFIMGVAAWFGPSDRSTEASSSASTAAVPVAFGVLAVGLLVFDHFQTLNALAVALGATAMLAVLARVLVATRAHDRLLMRARADAVTDPLTALPNRTLALDRLTQALARRRREGTCVAVLALDLDRFKVVNDSLGHQAGDDVLIALAPRLTAALRPTDTVARIGGDEFIVICPNVDGAAGATDIAERLSEAVERPLVLSSSEHFLSVSIGIAITASHNDTADSVLRDADAALYRAKDRGRGRYEHFDAGMRERGLERARTEAALRRALARREIQVWYQPVIDLASGRTVSMEALARWEHPQQGFIPPLSFIPIAEETGLIVELGLHVLEQACRQTAAWQQHLHESLEISVNVSGRQVVDPAFAPQVRAIAESSGIRRGTLAIEITESVLMEEADAPATVLATLHQNGVRLALDDFGTGYSSLSRLKRFALDVIKIDRSFIAALAADSDDRAIVKATIDMAQALGLTVVAEGVETTQQEEVLQALGCGRAQGYLYARPQPAGAITDLLALERQRPEVAATHDVPPSRS